MLWRYVLLVLAALSLGPPAYGQASSQHVLVQELSTMRGRQQLGPIGFERHSSGAARAHLKTSLLSERSAADWKHWESMLRALGCFSGADSMLEVLEKYFRVEEGSYYDARRHLAVVHSTSSLVGKLGLVHAIAHAIQDQDIGLTVFQGAATNADEALARKAVLEGSAWALAWEYWSRAKKQPPPWGHPQLGKVAWRATASRASGRLPLFLAAEVSFAAWKGLVFVAGVRKVKSWDAIDEVLAKPPLSTEQILHPNRYASYEPPTKVSLPKQLAGLPLLYSSTLGEWRLRSLLRAHGLRSDAAIRAAMGWGGDSAALYQHDGRTILLLRTHWDGVGEAIEFQRSVAAAGASLCRGTSLSCPGAEGQKAPLLWRRGQDVALVLGAALARARDIESALWPSGTPTKTDGDAPE